MDKEKESSKLMTALNKAYDLVVSGGLPGADSAQKMAITYLRDNDNDALAAAESLVRWQNAKSATSGFVTGLGGLLTIPISLPANVMSVLYVQVQMIAAIAAIGGHDVKDDRVRTMVFVCLAGNSAMEILKSVGISAATALGKGVIKQIPKAVISQINKAVGVKLVTKFGTKGVINLGKALPFLGGILGAAMDGAATNFIGNTAIRAFIDEDYS